MWDQVSKRRRLAILSLASLLCLIGSLAMAAPPPRNPLPFCQFEWFGQACATETFQANDQSESIMLTSSAQTQNLAVLNGRSDTDVSFDVTITDSLSAGDRAFVAVVNLDAFAQLEPDIFSAALPIIQNCPQPFSQDCKNQLAQVVSGAKTENIERASLWWAGCAHHDGTNQVSFTQVPATSFGYVVVAAADSNSAAYIDVEVMHHSKGARTVSSLTCGPLQIGRLPAGS